MKVAYLITAYQDPKQLGDLISALNVPDKTDFYVHIDKKVEIKQFQNECKKSNVYFINNRVWVSWGGGSQVRSLINLFDSIFTSNKEYDRVVCASGSDYPIYSNKQIFDEFENHPNLEYVIAYNLSQDENSQKAKQIWLNDFSVRNRALWKIWYHVTKNIFMWISKIFPSSTQVELNGGKVDIWFSADYWALTWDAFNYVDKVIKTNPCFLKKMFRCFAPSELFIATILCNSKYIYRLVNTIENTVTPKVKAVTPLCYLEYYSTGVKILTEDDYKKIQDSKKMFCRKLNSVKSAKLKQMIDESRSL